MGKRRRSVKKATEANTEYICMREKKSSHSKVFATVNVLQIGVSMTPSDQPTRMSLLGLHGGHSLLASKKLKRSDS